MNRDEIEAEIARIRADREGKRGRWPAGVKERLAELEAMIAPNAALEGDDMTDETITEAPEQADTAAEGPAEAPSGNGRVTARNLTVPLADGLKNVPEGTVVDVPDEFLAAMIEAGRMEAV